MSSSRSLINDLTKVIAILQIIGGIVGAFFWIGLLSNQPVSSLLILLFPFFTFGILAGYNLLKNKKSGYILSNLHWYLQILIISGPAFTYEYSSLFRFFVFVGEDIFNFSFYLGPGFALFVNQPTIVFGIGLNLFPIIPLLILYIYQKQKKDNDSISDLVEEVEI